jgi:HSP20 family protein
MADQIVRWEPERELMSLRQAMDQLFRDAFVQWPELTYPGIGEGMALDMYQTDKDLVVQVPLPGVKPEDVDISVTGDVLTIKAERKEERKVEEADYFYHESRYGSFSRSVTLPVDVNADKAEAKFENGILSLTLPKAEVARAKKIPVKQSKEIEAPKKEQKK